LPSSPSTLLSSTDNRQFEFSATDPSKALQKEVAALEITPKLEKPTRQQITQERWNTFVNDKVQAITTFYQNIKPQDTSEWSKTIKGWPNDVSSEFDDFLQALAEKKSEVDNRLVITFLLNPNLTVDQRSQIAASAARMFVIQ